MQYNIHDAKTHFSKLVAAVEKGEAVTICRNGVPVMDCVPAKPKSPVPYGAWAKGAPAKAALDHMVEPTDDALLDDMGL